MKTLWGKGIKLFISLFVFLMFSQGAYASKLPIEVWEYVKEQLPSSTQRFDSVVVVSNDVMYIPLYPAQTNAVANLKIEYTYPAGKTLKDKPEIVVFNNNFVLLKLFKDKSGDYTLTSYEDFPMKVKLGVMPQDMLVPPGLKMPENLKLVLGDLVIPSKEEGNLVYLNKDKSKKLSDTLMKNEFIPLAELKNKKTYITTGNSKFMLVYDDNSKAPLYELKLSSLPSKIVASNSTKFALVVYFANKNLEIIDLKNERILTQIPLDDIAKDADIDVHTNMAYVSSQNANTIYCVDLNSAKLAKAIRLEQSPSRLAVSTDGTSIVFVDGVSGELFTLKLGENAQVNPVSKEKNISKILCDEQFIYAISRTQNKMFVYDRNTLALVDEEKLNEKPVDAILYQNKIYILCAKEGVLDIYDNVQKKIILSQQLEKDGFYSKITLVPDQHNILITGVNSKKFLLFDLEKMNLIKKQPALIDVSNIIIMDKTKVQDL